MTGITVVFLAFAGGLLAVAISLAFRPTFHLPPNWRVWQSKRQPASSPPDRERELAALNAIAATVSRSHDLLNILSQVLDQTIELLEFEQEARGGIFLLNEKADELGLVALHGLPLEFTERETIVSLDKCLCGHVVKTGEIVDATRVKAWNDKPGWVEPHGHVLVPLKSKGHVLGVMFLFLPPAHWVQAQEMQLLSAIGNQIGIGIENAQLRGRLEEQAQSLELLYDLGRRFSASLEPSEVLTQVVQRCAQVFETDACLVHLAENDLLTLRASHYGNPEERALAEALWSKSTSAREGLLGRAIGMSQAITRSQVEPEQFAAAGDADYFSSREWLIAPLRVKGRVLGTLTLVSRQNHRSFSGQDVTVAQEIANQAAAALENARLYHEVNRRLEEASLIQAVALGGAAGQPFDAIVADATERLRHLWDSRQLGFLFADEVGMLRLHPSYVGVSADLKRIIRIRHGEGVVGWVAQKGLPAVIGDVAQDSRYIATAADTRSEMAAPLAAGERVIGVINVESSRLNAFSMNDVQLLSALAGQLALILDNLQAHQNLAERAEQLQAAYAELAEAERLKEQLVQNLSHELRTPMTFVKGSVELMQEEAFGPLPPKLREPLTIVHEKTFTVERLVERIVTLQAVSPESLALSPITLTELAHEALARWRSLALQAGIELDLQVPTRLPTIAGDRKQLNEAFDNLISNAIKFSPQGGRVGLCVSEDEGLVHVQVADHGIGIPPDKLSKVFDRFYQVDGSTRRRFDGAGVGLAVARQIVESHGGRIWAESPGPGRGSTFHFALPTVAVA